MVASRETATDRASLFEGSCAVVTGAARGIGMATVRQLTSMGANVAFCDLPAALESDGLEEQRPEGVLAVAADVSHCEELENVFVAAEKRFGPVTVLVNNA